MALKGPAKSRSSPFWAGDRGKPLGLSETQFPQMQSNMDVRGVNEKLFSVLQEAVGVTGVGPSVCVRT